MAGEMIFRYLDAPAMSVEASRRGKSYAKRSASLPSRGGVVPGSEKGPMGDAEPHRQSLVQQVMIMMFSPSSKNVALGI